MDVRDRAIALYGRFSHGERERLAAETCRLGGLVARDLTRQSDVLVVVTDTGGGKTVFAYRWISWE